MLSTKMCILYNYHNTSITFNLSLILIDGQAKAWPFSAFTQKQVFGNRTPKSQPIWKKFSTHLLLYGIHLWADLDRDRHVGSSRPNQNDYVFFVILVTHPKSYTETMDRRDFAANRVEVRTAAIVKNSGIL